MATLLPFLLVAAAVDDCTRSSHPLWPVTDLDDVLQI